jgi:ferric-dicitrate binding protein FerR (iron transport regulator)
MQSDYTKYSEFTSKDEALRRLWNKEVSDISEQEISDALGIFRSRRYAYSRAKRRKMRVLNIIKYAALLLAPIVTAFLVWYYSAEYYGQETELTQYYVPTGRMDSLILSDNTCVKLDAGTSIIYPTHFSSHTLNRNVYVNGRCHFIVSKDPMHPFVVNMYNLKVKVLGTHFSIESYNDDDQIKVTLEEGLVEVFDNKQAIMLHPNEQLVYNRKDGTMQKGRIDALAYNSWVEGNVDFASQPLSVIIKTLERRYGVKFSVDKNINLNRCYTMNFRKGESIERVLKVLSMISGNIRYSKNGNMIQLY